MSKEETTSTFKVSIQLVWGFGSHQFQMSSIQTNNIKGRTDSDTHQQNMAFVLNTTSSLEVCTMLITCQALWV